MSSSEKLQPKIIQVFIYVGKYQGTFDVTENTTVKELKDMYFEKKNINPENSYPGSDKTKYQLFKMTFSSVIMRDELTMSNYKIKNGSSLRCYFPLLSCRRCHCCGDGSHTVKKEP